MVTALGWFAFEIVVTVYQFLVPSMLLEFARGVQGNGFVHLPGSDASVSLRFTSTIFSLGASFFNSATLTNLFSQHLFIPIAIAVASLIYMGVDTTKSDRG